MPVQLSYRKPHDRRLKSGRTIRVAGSWMIREKTSKVYQTNSFTHACPSCGAQVRTVRMPNGGWVHFEVAGGLHSLRHPCFYIGDDMRHRKDPNTLDLFTALG